MRIKCVFAAILGIFLNVPAGAWAFAQQAAPQSSSAPSPAAQPGEGTQAAKITPPEHPITLEQTREMFQLMKFRSTMQSVLHANLVQQRQAAPFIPEDVWQDFEESFAKTDFVPVFFPIFQKYFSEEDAAKALEFYRTPAGQHTLAATPALMQELPPASQAKGEEIARQVFERHHQEIEDAQRKFQQQSAPPSDSEKPK